jgi:hypothetical protein
MLEWDSWFDGIEYHQEGKRRTKIGFRAKVMK